MTTPLQASWSSPDGRCDRSAIARCPLYVASHVGDGHGCVDDLARPCAVSRGEMDYFRALRALIRTRMEVQP